MFSAQFQIINLSFSGVETNLRLQISTDFRSASGRSDRLCTVGNEAAPIRGGVRLEILKTSPQPERFKLLSGQKGYAKLYSPYATKTLYFVLLQMQQQCQPIC